MCAKGSKSTSHSEFRKTLFMTTLIALTLILVVFAIAGKDITKLMTIYVPFLGLGIPIFSK